MPRLRKAHNIAPFRVAGMAAPEWRSYMRGRCADGQNPKETGMNEDALNGSIRQFLKTVGVTSQREIEKAVRAALADGRLKGKEALPAKMTLTIGGVTLTHVVDGT